MIYYRNSGEVIEKFIVLIDIEKMKELKSRIINDCSFIEHKEFTSEYLINNIDNSLMKSFQYSIVKTEKNDISTRNIYSYSYNLYHPPYLVELMDRLMKNDVSAIEEIFNYDTSKDKTVDNQIKKINEELFEIDVKNIIDKRKKLKELEVLLCVKEINKNQKSTSFYYNRVLKLINFKVIDMMPLADLNKFNNFLDNKFNFESMINTPRNANLVRVLMKRD